MTNGKKRAGLWMSFLALLGCGGGQAPTVSGGGGSAGGDGAGERPSVALDAAVGATNRFTAELYRTVAQPHANGAASPYSVAVAFAMTREGARGETRAELDRALHLEGDEASAFGALSSRIDEIAASGVELRTANRVFVQQGFAVEAGFESALRDGFHAPFEALSFADAEGARGRVNGWVAQQTNDRIADLLPPGSIDGSTRLVLTNAVYFHGTWQTAFDRARTQDLPFFVDGTTEARVPTMQAERALRYARYEGVRVGELGYTGDQVSMIVVVPEARDGLPALLSSLDEATMRGWVDGLAQRPSVVVRMPRFRIAPAASISLRGPMEVLGVRLAFQDGAAELTGIADVQPPLFVSDGYHKAFVEVNEEGTEAAAATGVVVAVRSAPMRPVERDELIADRPFLFFLRDTRTGAVLFVGHVVDPR
jgi:serpin B